MTCFLESPGMTENGPEGIVQAPSLQSMAPGLAGAVCQGPGLLGADAHGSPREKEAVFEEQRGLAPAHWPGEKQLALG